jgi:hypothetical protein
MMTILFFDILVLDESYASTLLVYKARHLRQETGNWALHAKHEEWNVSVSQLAHKYGIRPFQIIVTPICFCMGELPRLRYAIGSHSCRSRNVCGICLRYPVPVSIFRRLACRMFCFQSNCHSCFAAFPIEFEEERGWNQLVGSLPFIATLIGSIIGAGINIFNTKFYIKKLEANNNRPVPEARLPPMMLGGFLFSGGFFVFAWTSSKNIHWIGSVVLNALSKCLFTLTKV